MITKSLISIFSLGNITITALSLTCEPESLCGQQVEKFHENKFRGINNQVGVYKKEKCQFDGSYDCFSIGDTNFAKFFDFGSSEGLKIAVDQPAANVESGSSSSSSSIGDNDLDGPTTRFGFLFQISIINNYGCWCYGGSSWPGAIDWTGFGESVDDYDEACKAHHMGHDCIFMDSNGSCVPNKTKYLISIQKDDEGNYRLACSDSNSECQSRVCQVDIKFLSRHWKLETENYAPDYESYGHNGYYGHTSNNSGFNVQKACPYPIVQKPGIKRKTVEREKKCCGEYPYRVWYDPNNRHKGKCCVHQDASINEAYGYDVNIGTLYQGITHQCCDEGVKILGDECF